MTVFGYKLNLLTEEERVILMDPEGNLDEKGVSYIVHYLYEEGFITGEEITCEIVNTNK